MLATRCCDRFGASGTAQTGAATAAAATASAAASSTRSGTRSGTATEERGGSTSADMPAADMPGLVQDDEDSSEDEDDEAPGGRARHCPQLTVNFNVPTAHGGRPLLYSTKSRLSTCRKYAKLPPFSLLLFFFFFPPLFFFFSTPSPEIWPKKAQITKSRYVSPP